LDKVIIDARLKHWYVCFSDVNHNMPGQKFLKRGFRHVCAFAFDVQAAVWIIFDPGWDGIVIRAINDPVKIQRMISQAYMQGPVLYCETEGDVIWRPRFLMACTSQICHLLGIDLFVHTPFRLFRALKERGATELIFED
jgi:hypothetical protein